MREICRLQLNRANAVLAAASCRPNRRGQSSADGPGICSGARHPDRGHRRTCRGSDDRRKRPARIVPGRGASRRRCCCRPDRCAASSSRRSHDNSPHAETAPPREASGHPCAASDSIQTSRCGLALAMGGITELEFVTASENPTPTSRSVTLDYTLFAVRGRCRRWCAHRLARQRVEYVPPCDAAAGTGIVGGPDDSRRHFAGGGRNGIGGSASATGTDTGCPANERAASGASPNASRNADRHLAATRGERLRQQPARRTDAVGDECTSGWLPRRPAQP